MKLSCFASDFTPSRVLETTICKQSLTRRAAVTGLAAAALFGWTAGTAAAQSKTATSTSLAITSGGNAVSSVAAGSVITLTAQVKAGGTAVTPGQVNFCDASAKGCADIHLLGTGQLTSAGTATIKLRPGIGSHEYKAVFLGTNTYASSASGVSTLSATGTIPVQATYTRIDQTGSWGAYTLRATVTEAGNIAPMTGTVSFLDTNNGNAVLGTGTMGAATRRVAWSAVNSSVPSVAAVTTAAADLNGDGILDLFVEDYFGTYNVLLGNGDGTFTQMGSSFGPSSQTGSFVLGDFNNDGIPDVAAINAQSYTPSNTITIFLGNGDGTFTVAAATPAIGEPNGAIATADVNGDGNADLILTQAGSSNGEIVILLGNGDGTFTQSQSTISTPGIGYSILPADLNGDGVTDLVIPGASPQGLAMVLLGKGDGTFTAVAAAGQQGGQFSVIADVNNDGIPDLIGTSGATADLSVYLGNGDGTFTAAPSNPAELRVGKFTVADLNQDGIPDIVYVVPNSSGTAGWLLGKGDGTFVSTNATFSVPTYFNDSLLALDFNGDGWPDPLLIDGSGRTVEAWITHPTETASASATVAIAAAGSHLAAASYPGDSNYKASTSGTIALWGAVPATTTSLTATAGGKTVSSVAFRTAVTLTSTVKAGTSAVTAGQVNFCDASAASCFDIHLLGTASLNSAGDAAFTFVPGPGRHSYKATFIPNGYGATSSSGAVSLTVGSAPAPVYTDTASVLLGGYSGDYSLTATVVGYGGPAAPTGKVSFIDTSFANTSLGDVTLGTSTAGTGWAMLHNSIGGYPLLEASADFNGDGIPDVAILWQTSQYGGGPCSITVFNGKGDGTFTTGATVQLTVSAQSFPGMIAGDFNGDGKADLAVLSMSYGGQNTNSVTTLLGTGDGNFSTVQTSIGLSVQNQGGDVISGSMVAADFNGDGKLDIAVVGACVAPTCGAVILMGNGDGTFTVAGPYYGTDQSWSEIVEGDFNGDGIPDLFAVNFFSPAGSAVLIGKGDGTFSVKQSGVAVDTFPRGMQTGDFNGDGILDVAIGYNGAVQILLGNGDGTFHAAPGGDAPGSGLSLVTGDFNHDGKIDLAGIDDYNQVIDLFTGAGDGTFTVTTSATLVNPNSSSSSGIIAADLNSDGVPDLALVTRNQSYLATLLTEPTHTATAILTDVAPIGAGTHVVEAKYAGDANYPSAVSGTVSLDAGLKAVTITPAGGTFTSTQTVTISEAIPGATIYYQAYGVYNTSGFVKYTGPISLSIGGQETITAYASEDGYYQSSWTTVTFALNFPAAPTPAISPSGGLYASSQTVTIADSGSGTSIYYTTDGTPPTTNSTIYSGPITVSTSETVAAMAAGGGYSPSPAAVAQYFIQSSQSRFIYTVAGSGFWGFGGDGGPAQQAILNEPVSSAFDAAGNLYIADTNNQVVRKVDAATGIISTVAGTGIGGYSGDGGPATAAQLHWPYGVAFDSAGNLYVSETGNEVVRRVDAKTGVITTYAGSTTATTLGDGGPATSAQLSDAVGIAFDKADNLYIGGIGRVRVVNASTGIISTFAGNGVFNFAGDGGPATSASLELAMGLAFDKSGNLYFADPDSSVVRKVTIATGIITTVAGQGATNSWGQGGYSGDGGPATSAKLDSPEGVAVDGSGNLYIADTYNYAVREVTAADGIINTIAGHSRSCTTLSGDGGPAKESGICFAPSVTLDGHGNLYITEAEGRVREITTLMAPPSTATAAPAFDVAAGTYATPQTLHITDATPGASVYVNVNGGTAVADGLGYSEPISITGSATINAVAVAPGYLPSNAVSSTYSITAPPPAIINTYAGNGSFLASGIGGPATAAGIGNPISVAMDGTGNLYILDQNNNVVWMVSAATGKVDIVAGIPGAHYYQFHEGPAVSTALDNPQAIAVDKSGNLYIGDTGYFAVLKVDAKTGVMSVYAGNLQSSSFLGDGGPATQAFVSPVALAFDQAGNLYIADNFSSRIREVSAATGIINTVAGGGTAGLGDGGPATSALLNYPGSIAIDSKGNFYIGDQNNGRVRLVDAKTGIITTFAGNGNIGATGDGGAATAAEIYSYGLAVDSANNLYIANSGDGIRMVPAGGGTITRVVGTAYGGFGGDGGAASMAQLCDPSSLVFDKAGSLYIADYCNARVRKVTYPGPAATPAFSPAAGTYNSPQTVTITDAVSGASIYYTVDGSTPTTGSTLYGGPITISSSGTLKAIAVASGYTVSAVASADYVIKQKTVPAISWAAPAPVSYGTPLGSAQLNATATVAGSFAYSPSAGTVLDPGQQTLSTTFTPTDTATYATANATVVLTVNKATPELSAVQSSQNPVKTGDAVTFTVNISSTVGSPSGTVTFMDGTATLGSATLSSGSATYTTSALAVGSHSITAVYSGDAKFAAATSAVLTQAVESFSLTTPGGSSSTATVSAGGQATYTLAVTPPAAGDPLTFSVTGLPPGATSSFSPTTVPAGAAATNVTLTVTMPKSAKAVPAERPFGGGEWPLVLGMVLLPFTRRLRRASRSWLSVLLLATAGLAISIGMSACGGSSGNKVTTPPTQTYTLTVTASSGTLTQSTKLTLIVQQ